MEHHEHPLSWEALTRIVLMAVAIFLGWKALGPVIGILIASVLAVSLYPVVQIIHRKIKIPVGLAILAVFAVLLIPFVIIGLTIVPTLNAQFPQLLTTIDSVVAQISFIAPSLQDFSIVSYIQAHSNVLVTSSGSVITTLVDVVTVIVLTFYFIYDYERLLELFLGIFPYKEKDKLKGLLGEVAQVTGQYIRGNVLISCITFAVIFIGLSLLHVPFALPLALFAGVLDLFPLVGSTIGSIPALFVAFSLSPLSGLFVLILHLVYQQIENAVISPLIYNKALHLYPSLGFLAVVVGASLFGILGAFLALPVAASIPAMIAFHKEYSGRHVKA